MPAKPLKLEIRIAGSNALLKLKEKLQRDGVRSSYLGIAEYLNGLPPKDERVFTESSVKKAVYKDFGIDFFETLRRKLGIVSKEKFLEEYGGPPINPATIGRRRMARPPQPDGHLFKLFLDLVRADKRWDPAFVKQWRPVFQMKDPDMYAMFAQFQIDYAVWWTRQYPEREPFAPFASLHPRAASAPLPVPSGPQTKRRG